MKPFRIATVFLIAGIAIVVLMFKVGFISIAFNQDCYKSDRLAYSLDNIEIRNSILSVDGYCVFNGDSQWSPWGKKSLILIEENSGSKLFFKATDHAYTLNPSLWGDGEHKYCGFSCECNISKAQGSTWRVAIAYQYCGGFYYSETGYIITKGSELLRVD